LPELFRFLSVCEGISQTF